MCHEICFKLDLHERINKYRDKFYVKNCVACFSLGGNWINKIFHKSNKENSIRIKSISIH